MLFLNFGQIQKYHVWLDLGDLLQGLPAVLRFAGDLHVRKRLQFLAKEASRHRLVVHDRGPCYVIHTC